ncbi:MAG TPA: LysR family transcriptional regulator [Bordetella sp.]
MDYYAAVRAFVTAAALRSFSKTAQRLGVKTSTVSRHVSELEQDLGIALFNRSTRGLVLTEGGQVFREYALQSLDALEDARQAASALNLTPQGQLRVTMPSAFGRHHIAPHLPAFMARYPDIHVDLVVTDDTLNLIDARIDVAVRIGALPDSTLMARRLASHRRIACASPDYLRGHPAPAAPQDLASHAALRFARQPDDKWLFVRTGKGATGKSAAKPVPVELRGSFRADDSEVILALALAGRGVALLPTWLAGPMLRDGRLAHLLPGWEARAEQAEPAIWAVYPPKKIVSSKVRAFVDFYAETIGETPYWDDAPPPARAQRAKRMSKVRK